MENIPKTLQKNIPLAPFTTFGIGGPADYFLVVTTKEELILAVRLAREQQWPIFILGCGANILIGDKGFRGLVIKNESRDIQIEEIEGKISLIAQSGAVIGDLIELCRQKGLSGFEHFAGIPSTVGGAIWQNLHFLSPERDKTIYIGSIVSGGEVITRDGEVIHVNHEYFAFGYDTSSIHHTHEVVLSITFSMTHESKHIIDDRIAANLKWRAQKHPESAVNKSAGSVFKKIEGYGAGRLIDQVGMKGFRLGQAEISPQHANFIMNRGGAKAKDVRELITLVQKKVHEKFGLMLEPEITFVGEF